MDRYYIFNCDFMEWCVTFSNLLFKRKIISNKVIITWKHQLTFEIHIILGMLAIIAGVIANFSAEAMNFGPVAPFIIAIVPLMTAFCIMLKTWPENYGNRRNLKLFASCDAGLRQILGDRKIFLVGIIQTAVESCMYIFVFLWTPVMMPINPPFGMVFACFMVAIMIGKYLHPTT